MHKTLPSLLLFSAILITFILILPKPVNAGPGLLTPFHARPTAYVAHPGVDDPTNAYDVDNTTYARIRYDKGEEYLELKTFNTTGAPTTETIAFVDFKIWYYAEAGSPDELYRIIYYVDTAGPVILQNWTYQAFSSDPGETRVWLSQPEPNDGVWNWTDIQNIRLRVEGSGADGAADYFYEYEAWVSVYSYVKPTVFVDPASLTDPSSPFTIKINISNVDDLYGWELKLYYNNTILTNDTVTEGTFLSNVGTTYFEVLNNTDAYNATHGRYWITCTLLGDMQGASGSGTLVLISFTVDGVAGTTPLDLVDTKLVGYEFKHHKRLTYMAHDATDGSVTISAVPEFPLGAGLEIALLVVIVYIWWRGRRKEPKRFSVNKGLLPQKQKWKYYFYGKNS